MHFGEYELSPSLIGLSLLRTGHPKAFQRLPVRTSRQCYLSFILPMRRSLGFASASDDSSALLGLAFAPAPDLKPLASPSTATRRFIMQKARRHHTQWLRPLVGVWFQGLFHSSVRGAFHLSFTVLVRYRSLGSI